MPVLVARKKWSRCCFSHGATRSSESPYDAAVSMWLTPCSSNTSSVASASFCVTDASAAAPNSVRVLSWPVRPKAAFAITRRAYPVSGGGLQQPESRLEDVGPPVEMEAQQRERCIERPEPDLAQQEGKIARARPQLGGE